MEYQSGLPNSDPSAPPFATRDGQPSVKGGSSTYSAVHASRPQSEARPEVVPSPAEVPSGGKVLFADPTGPSGDSSSLHGVGGEVPFKNLK